MRSHKLLLCAVLGLGLSLGACKKKTDEVVDAEPQAETTKPEDGTPKEDGAAKEEPAKEDKGFSVEKDAEVIAAIDAVIKNCKEVKYKRGNECPDKEQEKYDQLLYKKGPAALDTIIAIFVDKSQSPQHRQLAAHALNGPLQGAFGKIAKGQGEANVAAFEALSKAVQEEDPSDSEKLAIATVTSAVHLGNLAKKFDEVRTFINSFDPAKGNDHMWIRYHAVDRAMTYGRMELFELVKSHAEHENTNLQRAAFAAPRNMPDWSDEEDTTICTWAEGFISKEDKAWNAGPTWVLLRCKDREKYANMIIEEAKKRGKDGTFARPFIFAFRELCSRGFFGSGTKTSDEQCARAKKLLLIATDDEKLPEFERAMALSSIAYQWRDEESLKLMKKYTKHKNAEIAKMAKQEVEMLEKWLKKDTKKPKK